MPRTAIAAAIFGLVGAAVLVALGFWQLERLEWKEGLIAALDQRLSAEPQAIPAVPDRLRDDFLRVEAEGVVDTPELRILTSLKPYGPGYRIVAPFRADSRRILVDLGYVPEDEAEWREGPIGPVRITGALFWPEETDMFTPDPDRARNIWFARDLARMAEALDTEPLLVVAGDNGLPGPWPRAQQLGAQLKNDHLGYAITWFSLALIWAVGSAMLVRREARRT